VAPAPGGRAGARGGPGLPRVLDRWLSGTARRMSGRATAPIARRLTGLRADAVEVALREARSRLGDFTARLRDGDREARRELAAVAADALCDMRARVRAQARQAGAVTALAALVDRRWADTDEGEYLDDPALDPRVRTSIMANLDATNEALDSYERFLEALAPLLRADGRPTRVLDLAAGHGGFALAAARLARRRGLALRFTASDLVREYLDLGAEVAAREGLEVEFAVQDALDLSGLAPGAYDIVVCTQSLHHFPPGLVAVMFAEAARVAGRGVVFVDGCRSVLSGIGLAIFGSLRFRNPAFVHDAWVSARRFFVPEELELLARVGPWGDGVESSWVEPGHCLLRLRTAAP
jgi:ubiquinone/menaquinone biosynthesis C-methylase UbiE